ncbi:hypothetical protein ONZ51_g4988 [Trametes cubensis]|uniref:Fungal-type protein kinase domain-containing protein n=1 Tax=Trametes cubensis TaxID=1111947 RepID=A0AAD7X9U3_9APHY|nr:hypothetical protein ONZ51_g4988 [Trametes cubensis]
MTEGSGRVHANAPVKPLVGIIGEGLADTVSSDTDIDESDFLTQHFRPFPEKQYLKLQQNEKISIYINDIMGAPSESGDQMYSLIADLLTLLSKNIFHSLTLHGRERLHLLVGRRIVFLRDPRESSGLAGVLESEGSHNLDVYTDGTLNAAQYHLVETVVEVQDRGQQAEGRRQAFSHIHHILQARPDRPACYGMSATQHSFQLFYGSSLGLRATALIPWTDLKTLCAYVYSLYDPPDGHILDNRKTEWSYPADSPSNLGSSVWKLTLDGQAYDDARIVFSGYPFGRRTNVFCIDRVAKSPTIIEQYYIKNSRRCNEADELARIHADGDVPGVTRVVASEIVMPVNDVEAIVLNKSSTPKQRLVFDDFGMALTYAKSVNDLLKAVYDVLEVHRTVAAKRQILHRDVSLLNILMYPQRPPSCNTSWIMDMPTFIDEVMSGTPRGHAPPNPCALLIDYDHSCMPEDAQIPSGPNEATRREFKYRTGTPTYIARAVTVAAVPCTAAHLVYEQMPTLDGKAKDLYISAYGQARYNRYTDPPNGSTFHGGVPRSGRRKDIQAVAQTLPFYHRWEYDAESVFWVMYSILLRVRPLNSEETNVSATSLQTAYGFLEAHKIPEDEEVVSYADRRALILDYSESSFISAFLPVMQDVGRMLLDIREHIIPTWAVMDPPPPFDDHLHEAIQRCILKYLVEHEDEPIPLTPGVLRRTVVTGKDGREPGNFDGQLPSPLQMGSRSKRPREEDDSSGRRVSLRQAADSFTRPRDGDALAFKES